MRIDGLWYAALAWLAVLSLAAAEHHGQVNFNGLPVPGATVTAAGGDKKLVAVTDQQGAYSFPDLADGVWTIQVEMLCFATIKQEVAVAPGAPSPVWELKVLPLEEIHAETSRRRRRPAAAPRPPSRQEAANPKGATAAQSAGGISARRRECPGGGAGRRGRGNRKRRRGGGRSQSDRVRRHGGERQQQRGH